MYRFFLSLCLAIGLFGSLFAQDSGRQQTRYGFEINVPPRIYFDPCLVYSGDEWQPGLRIRLKIQYDLLQFTKAEDHYSAGYDVSLLIKDQTDAVPVFSTGWNGSVEETDFENTNSARIFKCDDRQFYPGLVPGDYTVYLELTDQATRQAYIQTNNLEIKPPDYRNISVSEIKLLDPRDSLSAEIRIKDQVSLLPFNHPLLANFYMYTDSADSVAVKSFLIRRIAGQEKAVREQIYTIHPRAKVSAFYELLNKNDLPEGDYRLIYSVRSGNKSAQIKKDFRVIWYEKPIYLYEFDLAIRPLRSILSPAEWERVKDLSSEDKRKWFDNFWKEKDPTPDTPLNEIQTEFYRRVDKANIRYGLRFKEGWQTDRGQTLLSYGSPDSIENSRYVPNTRPYEIWYYRTLKKKFTFVDMDRDENYILSGIEDLEENKNE